jgi:hypothetical protein
MLSPQGIGCFGCPRLLGVKIKKGPVSGAFSVIHFTEPLSVPDDPGLIGNRWYKNKKPEPPQRGFGL